MQRESANDLLTRVAGPLPADTEEPDYSYNYYSDDESDGRVLQSVNWNDVYDGVRLCCLGLGLLLLGLFSLLSAAMEASNILFSFFSASSTLAISSFGSRAAG